MLTDILIPFISHYLNYPKVYGRISLLGLLPPGLALWPMDL